MRRRRWVTAAWLLACALTFWLGRSLRYIADGDATSIPSRSAVPKVTESGVTSAPPRPQLPCRLVAHDVLVQHDHQTGKLDFQRFGTSTRLCAAAFTGRSQFPYAILPEVLSVVPPTAVHNPIEVATLAVVPLDTCFGNVWHGTVDFIFPLVHLLMQHRVTDYAAVRLEVQLPPNAASFWVSHGVVGCPAMMAPGFGFAGTSPTAFFISSFVSEVGFSNPEGTQYGLLNPHADLTAQLVVRKLVYGLDTSCALHPSASVYPFFEWEGSNTSFSRRCTALHKTFRTTITNRMRLRRSIPIPAAALRVLYVDRVVAARKNGRYVVNKGELFDALLKLCAKLECDVTFQHLEGMTGEKQAALVAQFDVVIMPRGAASIFVAFLRPSAAFLSLFPADDRPVSPSNDNFPWWPFPLLRTDLSLGFVPCRAVLPVNGSALEVSNCQERSVNFCDMTCDTAKVVMEAEILIRRTQVTAGWTPSVRWPETKCDEFQRCKYVQ